MPESTNITLMELSGRYIAGGAEAVIQRYPEDKHFLVIPPAGMDQPPLLWTSQTNTLQGNTEQLSPEDRKKILSAYTDPTTVITPLRKKSRNQDEDITFGRSNNCDVRFKSPETSKFHATLKLLDGKLFLRDHSTNGTFINQCQMLPDSLYQISPGQEIKFGITRTAYIDLEHLLELVKLTT